MNERPPAWLQTPLTQLLGIRLPVVQGGLAHLAFARLAAAVSNAGGLGQITAASFRAPDDLRQEIRLARSLTPHPFGVNFAIGHRPLDDLLLAALDEGVTVMSFTGGNPEPLFSLIGGAPVRKLVLVAAVRQAQKAEALGADAVIAVGFEGGGHIGRDDIGSLVLVPRVVDSVGIPVLASGGIGDGRGLAAALALGAQGIEMGTRFVATQECIASDAYKQLLVSSTERDTIVIERSMGRPGRAIGTDYSRRIVGMEAEGAGVEELLPLIAGERNQAAIAGALDEGYLWGGQAAGLIQDVPTVSELFRRMLHEAEESRARLGCA